MALVRPFRFAAFLLMMVACSSVRDGQLIYVDANAPAGGDGSRRRPLATLEEARQAVRSIAPEMRHVTVVIADGIYRIDGTLCLDSLDGGTPKAPVVYKARHKGRVLVTMGLNIPADKLLPIADSAALDHVKPEVASKVRVCNLTEIGVGEPFAPLADYRRKPEGPMLFARGGMATVARWPDEGFTTFREIPDLGLMDPDMNYPLVRETADAAFYYVDTCAVFSHALEDARINGYFYVDWYDESIRLAGYDEKNGVAYLAAPAHYGIGPGGWALPYRRFYVSNSLHELDRPGEWYLDRGRNLLYYYPVTVDDGLVLACSTQPIMTLDGTCNIRFEGLRFEHTVGDGIVAADVEGLQLVGCSIANLCGTGLRISGRHNLVQSCDLHDIGTGGISMTGGDRLSLTESGNVIDDCDIFRCSQIRRSNFPGIELNGVGNVVSRCHIHDMPHIAMFFNGNEHRILDNEIDNVLFETSDAGAIYSGRDWTYQGNVIRHNYIHDIPLIDSTFVTIKGIYLDDGVCGDTVEFNVLRRVPRAIMIGGGRDHTIRCNYVEDCIIGIFMDARGMEWWQWNRPTEGSWYFEGKAEAVHYRESPWKDRYPRLARIMQEDYRLPLYNRIQNNLIVNTRNVTLFNPNLHPYLHRADEDFCGNVGIVTRDGLEMVPDSLGLRGFSYVYADSTLLSQYIHLMVPSADLW